MRTYFCMYKKSVIHKIVYGGGNQLLCISRNDVLYDISLGSHDKVYVCMLCTAGKVERALPARVLKVCTSGKLNGPAGKRFA